MRKHWFAAIVAGLLVVAVGTAIASVPDGSSPTFAVSDPAVTAIASGQPELEEGNPATFCNFAEEALTYCHDTDTAFTPTVDAVCQVSINIVLQGSPGGKAGSLSSIGYGIGVRTEGETDSKAFDPNNLTTTPSYLSEQTIARTRLISVQGGVEYEFAPWLQSFATANGTAYWDMSYVCFG